MHYREATPEDAGKIARLHAQSWQQHYRGILLDTFLDGPVIADRLALWESRFREPGDNQYVLLAEEDNVLLGFACVFAGHDPAWGALLDNLHVTAGQKGKGIGRKLLKSAARWAYFRDPQASFYLWVYEKNTDARKFYDSLDATNYEILTVENPGGGQAEVCRYVWTDVKKLIQEK